MGKRAQAGRSLSGGEDGLESEEEEEEEEETEEAEAEDEVDTAASESESTAGPDEEVGEGEEGRSDSASAQPAAGTAGEPSVMESLDLKTVLPQAIKTGACYMLATWVGKNLSPTVESQVRMARGIYTAYLIFSQALCMYIR